MSFSYKLILSTRYVVTQGSPRKKQVFDMELWKPRADLLFFSYILLTKRKFGIIFPVFYTFLYFALSSLCFKQIEDNPLITLTISQD